MSATYRPALVWAGQAIMQGKLVFSQSLSTVLLRNLVRMAPPAEKSASRAACAVLLAMDHCSVRSTVVGPPTLIFLDCDFLPSCQAVMVYCPSGTLESVNSPSAA